MLVLLGCAVPLVGAEITVRVSGSLAQEKRRMEWEEVMDREVLESRSRSSLGNVIRPSEHPGVIYELRPDLDLEYRHGSTLTTNRYGLRGPEYHPGEHPGVFRIVTIGDSFMFGSGVNDGECTVRVMERALRKAVPELKLEVVNMAVPGFNTAMEVELLAREGLAYEPDLVLIDFVGNDLDLPNFLANSTDYWAMDCSFLCQWLSDRWSTPQSQSVLTRTPMEDDHFAREESVPPRYQYMVRADGYRKAMRRLATLADENGFRVVLTAHSGLIPVVPEMLQECGFPILEGYKVIQDYLANRGMGIDDYTSSELVLSKTDNHPTALGHRLVGEHYAEQLVERAFPIMKSR